jgi:excisionase family DNA binding protein
MEFLTVKETAQLLRVSPITVRRYIASGQLAAERVGRGSRVRREAIEEFITPVEPDESLGKPFTMDDPLWDIVGIGASDVPDDVASNKHKYVADAIEASWSDDPEEEVEDARPRTVLEGLGISVGIFRSGERTDIAAHKEEYLADAILASSQDDEDDLDPDVLPGKPTSEEDPLWSIIGVATSDEPNDVASNKHKYLADAILADKLMG